jgi:hypothetical protein
VVRAVAIWQLPVFYEPIIPEIMLPRIRRNRDGNMADIGHASLELIPLQKECSLRSPALA